MKWRHRSSLVPISRSEEWTGPHEIRRPVLDRSEQPATERGCASPSVGAFCHTIHTREESPRAKTGDVAALSESYGDTRISGPKPTPPLDWNVRKKIV